MPLPSTLNTNEVKNTAGTEVEFSHYSRDGREQIYANSAEAPGYPHRIRVSHQETGSGTKKRRRSLLEVRKNIVGQIDIDTTEEIILRVTADIPQGNLTAYTEVSQAMANMVSFLASQGANTTILYDGTGHGAAALINGTL
jgi:hypothetical protein